MKRLIILISIIITGHLSAQNWSPVLTDEKMNYQHSDSIYISNTIWVDSVESNSDNMIYHLNRIVKDVPGNPEIALRNQPQFLLKQMTDQNEGDFTFSSPGELLIKSLASLGDTWIFNQQSSITAEVTSTSLENIFGIEDSVKIISLSDGNEIQLSKSFGIIKFPDFENGGNYHLIGIQNTEFGESVPDFWDVFDFGVGDVFQFSGYESNIDFTVNWKKKITITTKEIEVNSFNYSFEGIYYGNGWNNSVPTEPFEVGYPITGIQTFTDSINHLVNSFPNQLHVFPNSYSTYGSGLVFTSAQVVKDNETDLVIKQFGLHYVQNQIDGKLFYELDCNSDTLYQYNMPNIIEEPGPIKGKIYKTHLGEIYHAEGFFEFEVIITLEGYIKDGDTVGTITPDSLLLVGVTDTKSTKGTVIAFPNPAHDYLYFKFPQAELYYGCNIEIRNLLGEIIRIESIGFNETQMLIIADLKPGIYLCSIKNKSNVIEQLKLVVQ